MSKRFQYYNIVPCSPGYEELQAQNIIGLEKKTGINIALYSLTLHPQGRPASEKAGYLISSYRKFNKALENSNIRVGVLLQSILGHRARVDKNEESWTRTITVNGIQSRFCTFDDGFRKYIFNTVAAIAKEKPFMLLGDDDIRSFSNEVECFCPLHTAEFNRRTNRNFTSEEFRSAVKNCKKDDEIYIAFEKLRQDTQNGLCKLMREAIDSVDPSIESGTCMSWWDYRFNGDSAKAIASKTQKPFMRLANGLYMEESPLNLLDNHLVSQASRLYYGDAFTVIDEADTCPHTPLSKSARSFETKLVSAVFAGLNGAKIWHVNCAKGSKPVSESYTDILEKYNGFNQTLANELAAAANGGVIIPCHKNFIKWHPVSGAGENFRPSRNWVYQLFGVYGIPFQCSFDLNKDGIYAISGEESIARFSDAELKQLLSRKLLLDGPAAMALSERGFSKYMGVEAQRKDFTFNCELSPDGKESYPLSKNPESPFFKITDPKVQIITNLGFSPYSYAPEKEIVAPGAVVFKNQLGGTIVCTAYTNTILRGWANESRKDNIIELLEKANNGRLPYVVENYQRIMVQERKLDAETDILGIFNLGFDTINKLSIRCADVPSEIKILLPDGKWQKAEFTKNGSNIIIDTKIECYEVIVLRIKE